MDLVILHSHDDYRHEARRFEAVARVSTAVATYRANEGWLDAPIGLRSAAELTVRRK